MRRTVIGWLGAGASVSALLCAGALSACSSGKAGTNTGAGGNETTATSSGHATSGAGATSATSTTGTSATGATSTTGTATSSSGGTTMPGDSVLTHHKNPSRDGVYTEAALTKAAVSGGLNQDASFSASLPDPNDAVYAQPLFVDGGAGGTDLVIVATEGNNVYAFDATTGATLWKTNLGAPVPLSMMNCGNIDPFGVTGTPAIDFASRTLFVTALVLPAGATTQKHEIFAIDIDTGAPRSGWPVDVGAVAKMGNITFTVGTQGSRGALALLNGTLYAPFGGLYGDCNPYHGWVLAVSISDPTQVKSWATALQGGGVWSMGGVSFDGTDLYVATGNTFGGNNKWGGGDATIRLGTGAAFGTPLSYFAPTNWTALDNEDLDMGTAPVVFDLPGSKPGSLALTFGKDGNAYLLDRANLGGVGTALQTLSVATAEIITAPALYTTATATYVAMRANGKLCTGGGGSTLTTLKIVPGSPPSLAASWCANGGAGSPMVTTSDGTADAIVWTLGAEGSNHLEGFDGDTGATIAFPGSNTNIPNMRRFNTPIAAKGRIYVPADNAVVAFTL